MSLCTAQLRENDCVPRESVFARLADDLHLPSPPGVVLQVLEMTSRLDCAPAELAMLIHRDAALCGKILRTVNSALYGLPRSITSIRQAVALLGLKPLRSLVLGLSLPALQRQTARLPIARTFWKESVAGAMIAHELALRLGRPSPEDDLVAGLLRDIGMLALIQACPTEYARLLEYASSSRGTWERGRDRCQREQQLLGVDHAEVSAFLLRRWWLPEEITEAIRHHHAPERADDLPHVVAQRACLLAFASDIAQLQLDAGQAELLRDIFAFGRRHYDLDESALAAFLEPLAKKIEDFATLVDLDIGTCEHYPHILARAAETLAQLTLENSVDQARLREQMQQAEQEAYRLRSELQRDALTGAFSRGCLEEQLRMQFRRACRRGTALGLVFIDLDNFKGINDHFGHLFGDRVLKDTSNSLFAAVRHGDLVARYGGDEFCVLVENTSPRELHIVADRLWRVLKDYALAAEGRRVAVSASLGAVLCLPRTYPQSATDLLHIADQAMYAAKSSGKNQISFVSLLSEADQHFLTIVEQRRFGTWLRGLGIEMPSCRRSARLETPGRLARRLGWLTTEQLRLILRERRTSRRRFDEIVSERGFLGQEQLAGLLALQLDPPEVLAADLVNHGIFSEAAAREKLHNYYQWLRHLS